MPIRVMSAFRIVMATLAATFLGTPGCGSAAENESYAAADEVADRTSAASLDFAAFVDQVLSDPDALAGMDIAEVNLLCAVGLPGSEDLQIEDATQQLDSWARHVERETDRHLYRFKQHPSEFQGSEAYFRMLMLVVVLQDDLGVRYNPDRINEPDFTNSKDLFVHGLISAGDQSAKASGGTCVSMPVVYVAVGRRLGYPLDLVVAKGHVFARWEGEEDRFNIEGTNHGLTTPDDDHYATWPHELTRSDRQSDWYLRSLTPAETCAVFLLQRGHCLEDTGDLEGAEEAYETAHRLAPKSPDAFGHLRALRERIGTASG